MKIRKKFSVSVILCILVAGQVVAQDEEIRRKQRAIFIYNITQQVVWDNPNTFADFKIAVLGDDPLFEELKKFEEDKLVRGKSIRVFNFFTIDEIRNVQLIYVHKRLGYDITEVLDRVTGDDVLIVSEDYGFNESMINMIEIGNTFQFEVNQARLELENFTIAKGFLELAISSADTWQDLYLASYESLQKEREKVAEQRKLLEEQTNRLFAQQGQLAKQRMKIDAQTAQIEARNVEVERLRIEYDALAARNEEQKKQFAENKKSLDEASDMLESQQAGIEERKEEIERLDRMLLQQMELLSSQENELEEQGEKLDYQRTYTLLFVILTITTIAAGFFIWRNYRIKKRSNLSLEKKNQEIENQAKELELKNQELEQFAYIASHDLQEPLNTIMAIAKIIPTDKLEDRDKQSLGFISDAASRMRGLIRGLLEYSRLGRDVTFSKVDCTEVMGNVQANLAQRLEETQTKLQVDELPTIKGHEVEITLLFQNLVSNAMKFVNEGVQPEISIGAEKVKKEGKRNRVWQFYVKDNGIGIEKKFLEKVFIIFKRLNAKNKYEGTGIGLAHCKKIVDLHGGNIWVESEVGKGSVFHFTLS